MKPAETYTHITKALLSLLVSLGLLSSGAAFAADAFTKTNLDTGKTSLTQEKVNLSTSDKIKTSTSDKLSSTKDSGKSSSLISDKINTSISDKLSSNKDSGKSSSLTSDKTKLSTSDKPTTDKTTKSSDLKKAVASLSDEINALKSSSVQAMASKDLGKATTEISDKTKIGNMGSVDAGTGKAQAGMAEKGSSDMNMAQMAGLSSGGVGSVASSKDGLGGHWEIVSRKGNEQYSETKIDGVWYKNTAADEFRWVSDKDPFEREDYDGGYNRDNDEFAREDDNDEFAREEEEDEFARDSDDDDDDPFAVDDDDDDDPFVVDDGEDEMGAGDGDRDFSGKGDFGMYGAGAGSETASEALKKGVTGQVGGGLDSEEGDYGDAGGGEDAVNANGGGQGTKGGKGWNEDESVYGSAGGLAVDVTAPVVNPGMAMNTVGMQTQSANTARSVLPRAVKKQPVIYGNVASAVQVPEVGIVNRVASVKAVAQKTEQVVEEPKAMGFVPNAQNVNVGRKAISQKAVAAQKSMTTKRRTTGQ